METKIRKQIPFCSNKLKCSFRTLHNVGSEQFKQEYG